MRLLSSSPLVASDPKLQFVRIPKVVKRKDSQNEDGYTIAYTRELFCESTSEDKVTTIVAIHGTLGSHRDFRYLAGALSNFGEKLPVELIRMDLPGYGSSKIHGCARRHSSTTASHYAKICWQFLDELYSTHDESSRSELCKKRFVLLGHSLAGHLVVEMARIREEAVGAIALVASIGLSPHQGIGGKTFYPYLKLLGKYVDNPVFGTLVKRALHFGYVNIGGFSKKTTVGDVLHSHQRVSSLDFSKFQESISAWNKVRRSTLVAFAEDDSNIEVERQEELAACLKNVVKLHWSSGGHNIQKTRSVELVRFLSKWIAKLADEL